MAPTVLAYAGAMTDDLDFVAASQALAGLEQLDVPALELLYKLECSGEDFYNLLAERIGNDDAAELLRRNGREELGHARRVGRAIAIKLGRDFEPSAELQERYAIELPDDHRPRHAARHRRRASRRATPATRSGPTPNPIPRWRACCGSTAARRPCTASGSPR